MLPTWTMKPLFVWTPFEASRTTGRTSNGGKSSDTEDHCRPWRRRCQRRCSSCMFEQRMWKTEKLIMIKLPRFSTSRNTYWQFKSLPHPFSIYKKEKPRGTTELKRTVNSNRKTLLKSETQQRSEIVRTKIWAVFGFFWFLFIYCFLSAEALKKNGGKDGKVALEK